MIFRFTYVPASRPIPSRNGATVRPRPLLSVGLSAGGRREYVTLLMDTGADDVIFPRAFATRVGVDLSRAVRRPCVAANGGTIQVDYAEAELTLVQTPTHYVRWRATVGFADVRSGVFGFAGGLEFFRVGFDWLTARISLVPHAGIPLTDHVFPAPEDADGVRL